MTKRVPAVVQYALEPKAVELRQVEVPEIGPRDVLLRTAAVGICGSDVHQYHNSHSWPVNLPVILGHEFGGTIERVGSEVRGFQEGDRVVSETAAIIDENSPFSRTGRYHLDPSRKGFGYGAQGAMTPYVRVPERCLHRIPDSLPFEVAALTEPCAVAYQAMVVNAHIRLGDTVVVIGPGPIGLLCAQMAHRHGAGRLVVVGTSKDADRLRLAATEWGAIALNAETDDVAAALKEMGDGYGAEVVVDAAGVSKTFEAAMQWVRPQGQIVKVGWGPAPLGVSLDPLVQKAVQVQGSFSHTWAVWERVIDMLDRGQIDVRPIISRTAPLEDWQACFDGMSRGELIKAVLLP